VKVTSQVFLSVVINVTIEVHPFGKIAKWLVVTDRSIYSTTRITSNYEYISCKAMIGFLTVCLIIIFLAFDRPFYNGRPIHSSSYLSGGTLESHYM
jgi:hypothetical protein